MGHLESAKNGHPFTVQQVPRSLLLCIWPAGCLGRAIIAKPGGAPESNLW